MRAVGVRELKSRLSEYVRRVRGGEEVQLTHRGEVVAELRPPGSPPSEGYPAGLRELIRQGAARQWAANDASLYPAFAPALAGSTVQQLLDEERGDR